MHQNAYDVFMPGHRSTSVVFASPHSGRDYGWAFLRRSALDEHTIRSSEDAFVDMLFADAPAQGAPLLVARAPRAFVDFNRGPEELDPALIRGLKRGGHNPRVSSGLGVIPRVVAGGREIYRGKLTLAEAQARLQEHWFPYHARLQALLNESNALFGQSLLVDCHSMPHEAVQSLCRTGTVKPEIVVGDRFGAAAAGEMVDRIEAAFRNAGFKVGRNTPFAGAYTAQAYGRPSRRQHVVQIEIDRSLYMNEAEIRPNGNFDNLRRLLGGIIAEIAEIGRPADEMPLAAE
ncbi:N-formylglutamate amidohydrolase [Sinisalibacter aestuarii]|uniref:N-formylglutamate amidohydrolase n=1 Tax=Sinisalibacter aestuarii TaxID=2949426 RepID=A0ABQ5LP83_9RHOB|nr:N-formylglutamate amidohydrolase [Sinisalibacter aestuarii]GKY86805.1 N-formylglutamate amidohydrolase [Sinisalibacter aestuarii]